MRTPIESTNEIFQNIDHSCTIVLQYPNIVNPSERKKYYDVPILIICAEDPSKAQLQRDTMKRRILTKL